MDLSSRPRHTHRSIARARARADAGPADGLSRWQAASGSGLSEQQAESDPSGTALSTATAQAPSPALDLYPGGRGNQAALSYIADTLEEQAAEAQEITARMKAVLNQCLLMAIADSEQAFEPPLASGGSRTPEELLRALARAVAASGGARAGWRGGYARTAQQPEEGGEPDTQASEPEPPVEEGERAQAADIRSTAVAALVKRHRLRYVPAVTVTPDGLRLESFENGAEIVKDALGRVLEVKSAAGEGIALHYDQSGNLERFQRSDSAGRPHSEGQRDRHGVLVRDPDGRVRACGELMTVDPHGCLSVHNHDGQLVSLDLVRELHIERRRVGGAHGGTITAVFARDGFRMTTHFHEVSPAGDGGPSIFSEDSRSPLRFYGRDGSLVEFASDEDLLAVRPSRVLPPGSLFVDLPWRAKRRARTAWEAVQEYLELLL